MSSVGHPSGHPSQPCHPDIANAFFRAGSIEAWGRGIELMRTALADKSFREPAIEYETSGLWVNFQFPSKAAPSTVAEEKLGSKLGRKQA